MGAMTWHDATMGEEIGWSRFQNGGATTIDRSLPTRWSPRENIAWTAAVDGYGQSTPIVLGDAVVVTSTSGEMKDNYHVACFALADGQKRWQMDFENPSPFANTPMVSRAAPSAVATSDGNVVAFFEGGLLVGLTLEGTKLWQCNLVDEFGPITARHGLAASLETDRDRVYVWVQREQEPYVMAIDPRTGQELWKVPGLSATSWSSPRLIQVDGRRHLVCSASGQIVGFDPTTGNRLWVLDDVSNNTSNTPMPAGENRFVIGASNGRGQTDPAAAAASNGLVEIVRNDDGGYSANYRWRAKKATSTFGSPVVADNTIAIVNRAGVLYRLDIETGEQVDAKRLDAGGIWATPIVAGGNLYVFGYKGTTSVVALADGSEIASNRCWPEGDQGDKTPGFGGGNILYAAAVAGDRLILRRGDRLYAIGQ